MGVGKEGTRKREKKDSHCHVKDDRDGRHGCVEGHAGDARAPGDGGIPLFAGGLAEVDLDEEEGEVEHYAGRDDGKNGVAVGADRDEAEVGTEEGELEA